MSSEINVIKGREFLDQMTDIRLIRSIVAYVLNQNGGLISNDIIVLRVIRSNKFTVTLSGTETCFINMNFMFLMK